jgi:hypothetical protein
VIAVAGWTAGSVEARRHIREKPPLGSGGCKRVWSWSNRDL